MCPLLKFDFAKFDASNLFLSNVIKGKHLAAPSPLVKEKLKQVNVTIAYTVCAVLFCLIASLIARVHGKLRPRGSWKLLQNNRIIYEFC